MEYSTAAHAECLDGNAPASSPEEDARLTGELDFEDRLDFILSNPVVSEWFAPEVLDTLAYFYPIKQTWGLIKARHKEFRGDPFDLEKAVKAVRDPEQATVTPRSTTKPPASDPPAVPGTAPAPLAFRLTKEHRPRAVLYNVLEALEQDPRWQGVLGYNELSNCLMFLQRPPYEPETASTPYPRPIQDWDCSEVTNWLQGTYELYAATPLVTEGLITLAHQASFHPIRAYLQGLTWDGTTRLETWLSRYCQAEDTAYTRAVGTKTLLSAVARIMEPGCKVDTVCITEGEQGTFKSSVWRTLASDPWFTDSLPDLHDKDAAQALRGKWFVELGELAVLQRSEVETIKRFISANQDHYRPSFGRVATTHPRHNIFVGSTNKHEYFKDETGNRRFWPVKTYGCCAIADLERDRDQLWAEAYALYCQGAQWHLTPEEEQLATQEQAARVEQDPWEDDILAYVQGRDFVTIPEIFLGALHFEQKTLWTQAHRNRIGAILRNAKWKPGPKRLTEGVDKGKLVRGYLPPDPSPVTPPPRNNPETRNTETPFKNNDVTGVTGVTGISNIWENRERVGDITTLDSIENARNTRNTRNTPFCEGGGGVVIDAPLGSAPPACASLTASVLWCATCQAPQPCDRLVRGAHACYFCAVCHAVVGEEDMR